MKTCFGYTFTENDIKNNLLTTTLLSTLRTSAEVVEMSASATVNSLTQDFSQLKHQRINDLTLLLGSVYSMNRIQIHRPSLNSFTQDSVCQLQIKRTYLSHSFFIEPQSITDSIDTPSLRPPMRFNTIPNSGHTRVWK